MLINLPRMLHPSPLPHDAVRQVSSVGAVYRLVLLAQALVAQLRWPALGELCGRGSSGGEDGEQKVHGREGPPIFSYANALSSKEGNRGSECVYVCECAHAFPCPGLFHLAIDSCSLHPSLSHAPPAVCCFSCRPMFTGYTHSVQDGPADGTVGVLCGLLHILVHHAAT